MRVSECHGVVVEAHVEGKEAKNNFLASFSAFPASLLNNNSTSESFDIRFPTRLKHAAWVQRPRCKHEATMKVGGSRETHREPEGGGGSKEVGRGSLKGAEGRRAAVFFGSFPIFCFRLFSPNEEAA